MKKSTIAVFKEIFKVINISGIKISNGTGDSLAVFFFENDFSTGVYFDDVSFDLATALFLGPDPSFALKTKMSRSNIPYLIPSLYTDAVY